MDITPHQPIVPAVIKGSEVEVTASNSDEMGQSQAALIAWATQKVATLTLDRDELKEAYEHALKRKWRSSTLKRHHDKVAARVEYYTKVKIALEHGYIIIPNFPVSIFAIRTKKEKPLKLIATHDRHWNSGRKEQLSSPLPIGDGEYKNPFPEVTVKGNLAPGSTNSYESYTSWAAFFKDLDFPITMAKPRIMEATSRAMALKIFDDFGIFPGPINDNNQAEVPVYVKKRIR